LLQNNLVNYPVHLHAELTDYISLKNQLIAIISQPVQLANLSETNHAFVQNLNINGIGLAHHEAQEILYFFMANVLCMKQL